MVQNTTLSKEEKLPNFMSEKEKISYIDEVEDENSWLAGNLTKLMIGVSVVWFVIVLIYITRFFGWSNLFLMMPDEFGGFLAGVTLPLAIIWVVMAYIDRGSSFKKEAKFLRAYMNQLVYPEDGGAQTAKAMADAIRSQVVELQEVTKQATLQTEKIKNELGGRVDDFAKLVAVLDNYSTHTITELSDGVKTLVKSFDNVVEKAGQASIDFENRISGFNNAADNMQDNFSQMFATLIPHIQEMKSASELLSNIFDENQRKVQQSNRILADFSEKTRSEISHIAEVVNAQTAQLADVSSMAVKNCDDFYQLLNGRVDSLETILKKQTGFVNEHVAKLNKNSDELAEKFGAHSVIMAQEVDQIMTRAASIEESIAVQVNELKGISSHVAQEMEKIEENIREQAEKLSGAADDAAANVSDAIVSFNDASLSLQSSAQKSVENINQAEAVLSDKNEAIQKSMSTDVEKLNLMADTVQEKLSLLQTRSAEVIGQFDEVGVNMQKHADALQEASTIVVAQSKVSEASLSQQQRHINASASRVEEIKGELKRQLDELTRAAGVIDDEAAATVEKLQKQMNLTLHTCEAVVEKTKGLNESLSEQSSRFDSKTNQTLAKVVQLEDVLNKKAEQLDKVSQEVLTRANEVDGILERQLQAVGEATENSGNTFKEIMASFENQSAMLNSVAENTVGYVADTVQALDDKVGAINLIFKHQENTFFDICDKISENTANISSSLKTQVASIEQSADRVFARLAMLEEDVNKRSDTVVESSLQTIDRLAEMSTAINDKNNEVNGYLAEVTDKMKQVSENFRHDVQGFNNIVKDIHNEATKTTQKILDNYGKLKEANENLSGETKNVASVIDEHLKSLDVNLVKVKAQADNISETFEHQQESLGDILNVVNTQTRLGEASLAQQYKYLTDVSTDVAQKLNDIQAKFKSNLDAMQDASTKVAYEFDVLGDRLLKVSEDINKASKNSIKSVEQVNLSLSMCSENVAESVENAGTAVKNYEQYIAGFHTVTAEASTGVVELNDLISRQSDKMIKISEDTKALVDCFNTVLNDTSKQLSIRANDAFDKVKGLGDNLKNLGMQMEDTTNLSVTRLNNSGDKLRAGLGEIAANAERISNEIRSSGEVFLKQSGVLIAASDDTLQKVQGVMKSLDDSSEAFASAGDVIVKKALQFNETVKKQVDTLGDTAQKADGKLSALEKKYQEMQIDTFLRDASYIIETMETVSVDINRIFNPKTEEEIWKRYYNGDSGAFVRHLAKTMTKQQILTLREQYEKNLEFRNLVNRYLGEFETLITSAKTNERSGILLSVISGADIGKLYYILAKAVDRLN